MVEPTGSRGRGADPPSRAGQAAVILVSLGCLLYRPWQPVPFDVTDFPEFLPLLQGSSGAAERLVRVVAYYWDQGRTHLLSSVLIVVNWELFGEWAAGWRLGRVVVMFGVAWSAHRFMAGVGIRPLAATLAAMPLVVGRPATHAWLRFTAEPLAALLLLASLGLAVGYRAADRWAWRVAGVMAMTVSMVLAKEVMVGAVPLVLFCALCWEPGCGLRAPRADRRSVVLTLGMVTVGTAVLLLIVAGARSAGPDSYAASYGVLGGVSQVAVRVAFISFPPDPRVGRIPVPIGSTAGASPIWLARRPSRAARGSAPRLLYPRLVLAPGPRGCPRLPAVGSLRRVLSLPVSAGTHRSAGGRDRPPSNAHQVHGHRGSCGRSRDDRHSDGQFPQKRRIRCRGSDDRS